MRTRKAFDWAAPGDAPGVKPGPGLRPEERSRHTSEVCSEIIARRAASRRRHRAEREICLDRLLAGAASVCFIAGLAAGLAHGATADPEPETDTAGAPSVITIPAQRDNLVFTTRDAPRFQGLAGVNLPAEVQREIYQLTGGDAALFGTLMGIADWETRGTFDATQVGDGGRSYGIFQINVPAQVDRLERLGLTPEDLLDPVKGATAAIDVLQDLADRYGFQGQEILMAYNLGPTGARKAIRSGTTSTDYSTEVQERAIRYTAEAATWE